VRQACDLAEHAEQEQGEANAGAATKAAAAVGHQVCRSDMFSLNTKAVPRRRVRGEIAGL
jgi:hypothetical protein